MKVFWIIKRQEIVLPTLSYYRKDAIKKLEQYFGATWAELKKEGFLPIKINITEI